MKKNYFDSFVSALRNVFCHAEKHDSDACSHECTSWMVFDDLTKNNTFIIHKNRDAGARNILPLISRPGAERKWIGLGDRDPENPGIENVCMGLNTSGLIAIVNSGEKSFEQSDPAAKTETPAILKICLDECDTAAQAVEKLEEIRAARMYAHGESGSIFFFMDLKEGFIVDMTADRRSVVRYDHGYVVRANIWHNPDMAPAATNTIESWLDSCNREFMAISGLNRVLRANGKLTPADMLEISREAVSPEKSPIIRALCYKTTNSSSTLELDLAYPDVLSTGYFLIGPLRHTICVPVPICAEKYHPKMLDYSWSAAAWKRFEEMGYGAEVPAEWKAFEENMFKDYKAAQADAEQLLKAGQKADAVRLLNEKAAAIWEEAAGLLAL